MNTYNARDIWNLDKNQIWNLPDGPMVLVFEDGTLDTNMRATVFSYYLGTFQRHYPKTPLLMRHHIGDQQVTKSLHLKVLGYGLWDCLDAHEPDEIDVEDLTLLAYQATNEIYNDFTTRLKSFVSTISILDALEVMDHPEIKKANESVFATQLSIDQTYRKIKTTLTDNNELKGNTISRMAKSGLVSMGQIQQCVGPRGYLTDIDSNIFPHPILTGYIQGIDKLHDSMIESRSASKAAIFTKDPVAESEYFNREMQLVATTLARIHPGDCGSKEYIPFKVRSSDLNKIAGKYYKADDGNEIAVTENCRHLIGKLIQMRSVLKCQHPDHYGVCSKCFGELAVAIPYGTNLGHVCTTVMCEKISQNVLSTKHLDGSSKVDDFDISEHDKQFIRVGSESNLKLSEKLLGKKIQLTLSATQADNLASIDNRDVRTLPLHSISTLSEVALTIEDDRGLRTTTTVPVSMGTRYSSLSYEALEYIKKHGWVMSDKGNYVIDLTHWDIELPLFILPLKHTDMVQYMKSIKSFIMASGKGPVKKSQKSLRDYPTVEQALFQFYNLISSKLTVNIVHLETIVLSAMIRSESQKDHRLPSPIKSGELGSYGGNMLNRSMGASMAYERQGKKLTDIRAFTLIKRPDHPMDNLLMPFPHINPQQ